MTGRFWRPLGGSCVRATAQREEGPSREGRDDRVIERDGQDAPNAVIYSLISGAVAALAGAAAGLAVTGLSRIAIWSTVAGAASVASGLAWDSVAVNSLWSTVRRRPGRSSSSSASS